MAEIISARKPNSDHRRVVDQPSGLAGDDGAAVAEAGQRSGRIRPVAPQAKGPGRVRGAVEDSAALPSFSTSPPSAVLAAPAPTTPPAGIDDADGAAGAGLVTYATSARITVHPDEQGFGELDDLEPDRTDAGRSWVPRFPTTELVRAAAALWHEVPWDGYSEGPRPAITIGPGVVSLRYNDLSKAVRRELREDQRRERERALAQHDLAGGEDSPGRVVERWSARSVARMVERLAQFDWSPIASLSWAPAAVTLTYPGGDDEHWLEVAPDYETVRRHLRTFEKRYKRAWGYEPVWVAKLEFQRRGAPHWHLLMKTPQPGERAGKWRRDSQVRYRPAVGDDLLFREWVSVVWTDIVADPDPEERRKHLQAGTRVDFKEGARCRDPRRAAVYFTKHGTYADKAYQNVVPEAWREPGKGPGRFWSYKGLERATSTVLIDGEDAIWAKRIMRRWSRTQRTTLKEAGKAVLADGKPVQVPLTRERAVPRYRGGERVESKYPEIIGLAGAQLWESYRPHYRKVHRRVKRFANSSGGGFLCVNDAAAYSSQLVRAVELARRSPGGGGHAPLPQRDKYVSKLNLVVCELGGRLVR